MVLLILTGGAGMVLHYRANMEFKLEMDPTLGGLALFWSVVRAKTPPPSPRRHWRCWACWASLMHFVAATIRLRPIAS